MHRTTGSSPEDLIIEGSVEAGVFGGKSDALREFVRGYFEHHENQRPAAAEALYERGRTTLGDAARLTGVDRRTIRDTLREHGVEPRTGTVDQEDAAYVIPAARALKYDG